MQIVLKTDDEKNLLLAEWADKSPALEALLHSAGGAWEDFNVYRFPLTIAAIKTVNRALKAKDHQVRVHPESKKIIKDMITKDKEVRSLQHKDSDAELSNLLVEEAPFAAEVMRGYQRAGVRFMTINESTLLADSPGSGKTLQTIATMISSGVEGDILVLAPSAASQVTWPDEIRKWAPKDEFLTVTGTRKAREEKLKALRKQASAKRRWVLCNIEMAKTKYHEPFVADGKKYKGRYEYTYPELFFYDFDGQQKNRREWSAIVVDESHKALITNQSQSYKQTQTRCGLGKLATIEGGKRIAISGTPFRGKLQNLWGTLNWLFPKKYTSYWDWVENWFSTSNGFFGGTEVQGISGGMEKAFHESFAPFTLRRTKAEIAPELPPKMYAGTVPPSVDHNPGNEAGMVGHWLEMSPKQKKAYTQMEEEATANLETGTLVANGVLAELTRLKQFATSYGQLDSKVDSDGFEILKFRPTLPSNKYEWLKEFIEELGILPGKPDGGQKVVVASQFTSIINLIDADLRKKKYQTAKITGGVPAKARQEAVKAFQSEEGPQIFLLNTYAGGVSLTLDRADDIVILDETFIPDEQEQVEDRIHRVSRNHSVTIHYLRSLGTVEEKIAKTTAERESLQKRLLDGERGIDFARHLLKDL